MDKKRNIWVPRKSLGLIALGEKASKYEAELGAVLDPDFADEDLDELTSYFVPNSDLDFDTEDGIVTVISSSNQFWYEGQNLVGKMLPEIVRILGREPDKVEEVMEVKEGIFQLWCEFHEMGLGILLEGDRATRLSIDNF